jgi:imidazolonepropionase-like amidohydrolase
MSVPVDVGYVLAKKWPAGGAIASRIAGEAYRRGVLLCTGTDDDPDMRAADSRLFVEIERLRDAGLRPLDVITAATANGALALGLSAQMGTLAAGKMANFVILRRNPLVDIHNLRSVEMVVKHGKQYARAVKGSKDHPAHAG